MTIHEIIQKRRSRRAYDTKPIDREILIRLVEAAHLAPSYANKQSWR